MLLYFFQGQRCKLKSFEGEKRCSCCHFWLNLDNNGIHNFIYLCVVNDSASAISDFSLTFVT